MTIFGPTLDKLTVADLGAFFSDAPSEALEWEAKSELNAGSIRKQVCGFANSHDGGYLVLGIQDPKQGGTWGLEGVVFPGGDAPDYVTNLIATGPARVTPYPDGLDVRALDVGDGKQIAVVAVPPVPVPPCMTGGAVFERVSGKTIHVEDPARLAALFGRGDAARGRAAQLAETAAESANAEAAHRCDPRHVQFALGLAAVAYTMDVESRLFSTSFDDVLRARMADLSKDDPLVAPSGPVFVRQVTQDSMTLRIDAVHELGDGWLTQVSRNGWVGIHWTMSIQQASAHSVVERMQKAWVATDEILGGLDAAGARYLHLILSGGRFPRIDQFPHLLPHVVRGPLGPGADDMVLASIERELLRAAGQPVMEDQGDAQGTF